MEYTISTLQVTFGVESKFPQFSEKETIKTCLPFPTIYLCEARFSSYTVGAPLIRNLINRGPPISPFHAFFPFLLLRNVKITNLPIGIQNNIRLLFVLPLILS